jgi:hypothetical protein
MSSSDEIDFRQNQKKITKIGVTMTEKYHLQVLMVDKKEKTMVSVTNSTNQMLPRVDEYITASPFSPAHLPVTPLHCVTALPPTKRHRPSRQAFSRVPRRPAPLFPLPLPTRAPPSPLPPPRARAMGSPLQCPSSKMVTIIVCPTS